MNFSDIWTLDYNSIPSSKLASRQPGTPNAEKLEHTTSVFHPLASEHIFRVLHIILALCILRGYHKYDN
jgi:hypothetical protein